VDPLTARGPCQHIAAQLQKGRPGAVGRCMECGLLARLGRFTMTVHPLADPGKQLGRIAWRIVPKGPPRSRAPRDEAED
jgi:hypothetical protein